MKSYSDAVPDTNKVQDLEDRLTKRLDALETSQEAKFADVGATFRDINRATLLLTVVLGLSVAADVIHFFAK